MPDKKLWGGRRPRPSRTSRSPARRCRSPSSTGWRGSRVPRPPSTASSACCRSAAPRASSKAAREIAAGKHDAQFPIDVFQTGSGTSTNMNANEVIARLAGEGVHANDHVNMGQSSNDVFPSAVHLAALDVAQNELLPALKQLERSLRAQGEELPERRQVGAHAPDGRRARDARPGVRGLRRADRARAGARRRRRSCTSGRSRSAAPRPGTGLNTHPRFAEKVRARLRRESGLKQIAAPLDPFEAQANRDALVELSGALKVLAVSLTKIAGDLALMGSGPRAGIGELLLPELQKGSSIMPGKVNPVIPRGRAAGLRAGDRQRHRDHRRRDAGSVRAQRAHPADRAQPARSRCDLLTSTARVFAEKCVDGIEANRDGHATPPPARRWRWPPR